ncbi:heme A synthase [Limimaricola cinnabarinus]|uniref:Heme A synthase n=1 Tax=Limimaricola cinnabarinus LL-001 TaxID=1337093 RepID=U2YLW5_9RHOB|nr:heme A synthase [Limimaricola cinnabarinus]GAD56116.1 heme A synthase, cytochrome oxidase biogenesis protein Cox15-CtaA [Limimaricola cinnabarinus LL-001]
MAKQAEKRPRSIFEEVGTNQKSVATPGGIDRGRADARRGLRIWLGILFVLVAAIVFVGGMTRLTDSGLSITEWNPVSGAIPPLSAADWDVEFANYKASPQYELMNQGMEMSEFKRIFWWEWGHRQLGRTIGLVWALGFLGFLVTKRIPAGFKTRFLGLGALIGLQGAVGWWMVHSGLQDGMVTVASYRLATHLGLAFAILGLITWYILRLKRREVDLLQARRSAERKLWGGMTGLMHLGFLQIILGALVAGIDAGRAFPTWPLMGDSFLPPDPFQLEPIWRNFFEDAGLVQFIHRMSGYLLMILGVVVWLRGRRSPHPSTRLAVNAVLAMLVVQMVLGIVTAIYAAPLHAAITHQLGAVLLWVLILRARFLARYPYVQSLRKIRK